ncbi:MAG: tRNA (adenosine(37)-N6)-threonylcarbamoyltransferase complex ATPase subunit type 1 TsaE [Anaerolineae bacterium]
MRTVRMETRSAEETKGLGRRLAGVLRGGEVIALEGPLGAGKTTLVQGLAEGLGVRQPVTSPTFVLSGIYRGSGLLLSHLDLYRLSGPSEFTAAGLEDPLWDESVCVIEWAEKVTELLPEDRLWVRLGFGERLPGGEGLSRIPGDGSDLGSREIILDATGPRSEALLSAVDLEASPVGWTLENVG